MTMKEGIRVYGKKHERKWWGRKGRKAYRGNLLRKHLGTNDEGRPSLDGRSMHAGDVA